MALTGENARLNISCKEWQQKLKESEERSSASMRELQAKCKSLENLNFKREMEEGLDNGKSLEKIIENLEREMREMEEGLTEGLEEQEAGLKKKASASPGWISSSVSQVPSSVSQVLSFFSPSSGGSRKCERSVKDSVKSAIKDKTQGLKDELARVKAELTASQKHVDELKIFKQEQQNICDARETAQKGMQAKITAKDAELHLQHANVQRLETELATTKAEAVDLQNICNAKESELKEIESGLPRLGLDQYLQTAVINEEAHAEDRVASIIMNDMLDAENAAASTCKDPHVGNIAQESELTEIRVKLSAQEKLIEAYERDLKSSKQTYDNTYQAKMELELLEDADLPSTVDRAEQARRSVFFLLLFCFLIASSSANLPCNMQRVQESQEKLRCCGRQGRQDQRRARVLEGKIHFPLTCFEALRSM